MTPEETKALAQITSLLQTGQAQAATAQLEALAAKFPNQAEIPHLQAVLAYQAGDLDRASVRFARALELAPKAAHIHNNFANFLQARDQLDQAVSHYERAVALEPTHLDAQVNLGALLLERDPAKARRYLDAVLELRPRHPQASFLLGMLAFKGGDYMTAVNALTQAYQQGFEPFQCAYLMAEIAFAEQAYPQALALVQQALQHPEAPGNWHNLLGLVLFQLGRTEAADAAWAVAQRKQPESSQVLINRAAAAFKQQRLGEAEAHLLLALTFASADEVRADIFENLANTRRAMYDTAGAAQYLEQALALRPRPGLAYRQGLMLPGVYQSVAEIEHWRQRLEARIEAWRAQAPALQDPDAEVGETLFLLAHQGGVDRDIMSGMAEVWLKACPNLAWTAPHCARTSPKQPAERLRIGFVSRFFKSHTIAKLMRGQIARLPKDRFEVLLCGFEPPSDEIGQWLAEQVDQSVLLPPGLYAARQALAELELDILFSCDVGMESLTYFLPFARLAPLQAAFWGHPSSTGIPTLDCFFSSQALEGPDVETRYSEQPLLMKHLLPYYYRPERDLSAASELQLPPGRLYGCLQTLIKLHPEMDAIFAGLLSRDPEARILLLGESGSHAVKALEQRFAASLGELAERVHFHAPVSQAAYLELCAACLVHLDPVVYGGGNTSYEAFAVGAPVVTLPTQQLKGRITYALYQAMDWTELVAESPEDYLEKALRLGQDANARAAASEAILTRSSAIFERQDAVDEFAQALETAYRERFTKPSP